ncbi:hypothetical protein DUI87_32172 [Hirundo rustica rustica]|uniref:Gag polyprotein n=1 Tax=Hirundo rustica rustica TaxID=333673 RepID=A0A3M0IPJ4_HIRRU|nr:hypothetical protein DUI87_32172 [Hirundo rustica rustica]
MTRHGRLWHPEEPLRLAFNGQSPQQVVPNVGQVSVTLQRYRRGADQDLWKTADDSRSAQGATPQQFYVDHRHPAKKDQQIAGEGNYLKPQDQTGIPEAALLEITTAAKTSLFLTPDDTVPTQSFTNIKQGVDETFIKFVDCPKVALEKKIESKEAQKEMLIKMSMIHANSETKPILRSLPLDSEPTIDQMIEACVKHSSAENTVAQAVAQGIAQGVSGAFAVVAAKENQRCFNCGEYRHFMVECPQKQDIQDIRRDHDWLHNNTKKWWWSGNSQPSADQHRVKTSNAQPPCFHCTTSPFGEDTKDQFPHGLKTPAAKVPPEMTKTQFTLRYSGMGDNKPTIKYSLFSKGEKIRRLGMLDTRADVTLITRSEWPSDWELEPVAGLISGIGGVTTSW